MKDARNNTGSAKKKRDDETAKILRPHKGSQSARSEISLEQIKGRDHKDTIKRIQHNLHSRFLDRNKKRSRSRPAR